ncbi:MAG TPA: ArsA-related P-loop ATPase, partial [Candidatus Angelobacter sp.]
GQRVRKLLELMRDHRQSRAWAVMLPEPVPDRQTQRLLAAIKEIGVAIDSVFVNRVLLEAASSEKSKKKTGCKTCRRAQGWQLATLQSLQKKYGDHRLYLVRDFPAEIAGAARLKKFTGELWQIQTEK